MRLLIICIATHNVALILDLSALPLHFHLFSSFLHERQEVEYAVSVRIDTLRNTCSKKNGKMS